MEQIWAWGINVIVSLQEYSPELDFVFKYTSFLADEALFLIVLPIPYWFISKEFGVRLMTVFLMSVFITAIAKAFFNHPRPYTLSSDVKQLVHSWGPGFPSGHAQQSFVFWGYLASHYRGILWVVGLSVSIILLVGISRIYTGVHFPTDVIGGYLFGLLLILAYGRLQRIKIKWKMPIAWMYGLGIMVPTLLFIINYYNPLSTVACGVFMGFYIGVLLERKYLCFKISCSIKIIVTSGIVLVLLSLSLLYFGRIIVKQFDAAPLAIYAHFIMIGFWISFLAPYLLIKTGVANQLSEGTDNTYGENEKRVA